MKKIEAEAAGFQTHEIDRLTSRPHELLIPTLHQLSISSNAQVAFCSTLSQLQAFLSTHHMNNEHPTHNSSHTAESTLILINPISLHRNIASFSSQGLSRTFASAVEATARTKNRLLVVECPNRASSQGSTTGDLSIETMHGMDDGEPEGERVTVYNDPWEEQVSILNVTTKSFGAGEKGWVGRTVKIRTVVERWCVFERPRT